jgi:hypothetical protein
MALYELRTWRSRRAATTICLPDRARSFHRRMQQLSRRRSWVGRLG